MSEINGPHTHTHTHTHTHAYIYIYIYIYTAKWAGAVEYANCISVEG